MKIVTFNLRFTWDADGINSFSHRAGAVWRKIKDEAPDVIAFQEMVPAIKEFLDNALPEYLLVGQYRNKNYEGEGLFIAVKKSSMEVLGLDSFWLSPTPYVPGSRYDGQSPCPRICVTAILRRRDTGRLIRIADVHLDHMSDEAQILGVGQVMSYLESQNEKMEIPSVLLGDFNAFPNSKTIEFCDNCKKPHLTDITKDISVTFHGFGTTKDKIDYIYVSEGINVISVAPWQDEHDGIYLSDHYPVSAQIELK